MTNISLEEVYKNLVEKSTTLSKKEIAEIEAKSKIYAEAVLENMAAARQADYHKMMTKIFLEHAAKHEAAELEKQTTEQI